MNNIDNATQYAARLRANVDDFYADRVTYEEFKERMRATWDEIQTDATLHHNVSALLRGDPDDLIGVRA